MLSSRSPWWRALRALLLVTALLLAAGHGTGAWRLGFVTDLDTAVADLRLQGAALYKAAAKESLDPRIVIVDVDEKSLAAIGRWPWSRDHLAALVDELFDRQHAAVVGFDMVFAEPDGSAGLRALERLAVDSPPLAAALDRVRGELDFDARFARALADRNVVLGFFLSGDNDGRRVGELPAPVFDAALLKGRPIAFNRFDGHVANLPILARAAPAAGFFNNVSQADGRVRLVPLIAAFDGRHYESLALATYRLYAGSPAVVPVLASVGPLSWLMGDPLRRVELQQASPPEARAEPTPGRESITVENGANVRVPFRGPGGARGGSFAYVSAIDLLERRVAPNRLAGKLVLVGTSATGNYDVRATPMGDGYPGVEVHANVLSGLLDGRLPAEPRWSRLFDTAQLAAVAVLFAGWMPRQRAIRAFRAAGIAVAALIVVDLAADWAFGWVLPLADALLLATAIYLGTTTWAYVIEGRSRRALASLFGTYVPRELIDEMARDPARYNLEAVDRELTVMFCDMRNFTSVVERLTPGQVRRLVNAFFTTMTEAIGAKRGTLDKYIGDAIMAFWGAPLTDRAHAAHATAAALEMAARLKALNETLRERVLPDVPDLPEIGVGIGLNTGAVFVGDMGSSMRRSYTVMGDPVNLASRIEGLTRHYGVDILAGESTRAAAPGDTAETPWRWVEVDRVRVKGKLESVTLFTPVVVPPERARAFDEETRLWQLALAAHRLQHWADAQARLQALRTGYADSGLAGLYRQLDERTDRYRAKPPPDGWDGAHTFDSK